MGNKVFIKAAALLCHPLAIAAMLFLLFNDYWLRWYAPSWWSGKLGDFAGLFFAPFALGMMLALIVPSSPRQERIVKIIAFGSSGIIFASAKTFPVLMELIDRILGTILHMPVRWVSDPSDLIALGSLVAAWWLWDHAPRSRDAALPPALIALALAAMVMLGDAPASLQGVMQFNVDGSSVTTYAGYKGFRSGDGGRTWTEDSTIKGNSPFGVVHSTAPITVPQDGNIWYRLTPGVSIERSEDGGKSWRTDYKIPPVSQAATFYAQGVSVGQQFDRGPFDLVIDRPTGNAIFAMGLEGVLVREASGEYVWGDVGSFLHFGSRNAMNVLGIERILAINFGLLVAAALASRVIRQRMMYFAVGAGAFIFLTIMIIATPEYWGLGGEGYAVPFFGTLGSCLIVATIAAVLAFIAARRSLWLALRSFALAIVGALVFFVPYYLWALGFVPNYTAARLFAFALGAAFLLASFFITRGSVPPPNARTE